MDAREFYAQINHMFEKLARDAENIKDKEKSKKLCSLLSYLSDHLYKIGDQCYDISTEIDGVREYDFSELVTVLSYLSDRLYGIGDQCCNISAEIDNMR